MIIADVLQITACESDMRAGAVTRLLVHRHYLAILASRILPFFLRECKCMCMRHEGRRGNLRLVQGTCSSFRGVTGRLSCISPPPRTLTPSLRSSKDGRPPLLLGAFVHSWRIPLLLGAFVHRWRVETLFPLLALNPAWVAGQ